MAFLPDVGDVHVDRMLTNISLGVMNKPTNYVGLQVFPSLTVNRQTDIVPKYDEGDWLRDEAQERAPATESEGSGYTVDTSNFYRCKNYAFHTNIPTERRRNADMPFNVDRDATRFVTDKILMKSEVLFASNFFKTGVWTTSDASKDWTVVGNMPFNDIEELKITISGLIAEEPEDLVLGREVYGALKQHALVLDRMKYVRLAIVTRELIMSMFEIQKLHIGKAIRNTAKRGKTVTKSRILGKHALLLYVPSAPSLFTPAAGYTFFWDAFGDGRPSYVRRIYMPLKKAERIEADIFYDMKLTSADAGGILTGVVP